MTKFQRFTLWLATGVLVLWTTSFGGSAAGRSGVYLTPNGYRVPVYGMSIHHDADGNVWTDCTRLTQDQIESARFSRTVSRSMAAMAPRATVQAVNGAKFEVRYTDPDGTGFNDSQTGAVRKRALEVSMAAWSLVIQGTVSIIVEARMEDQAPDSTLLASAGPVDFFAIDGRAVPSALAKQLKKTSLNNEGADIQVSVNPAVDWDYATNGAAARGKASFVYTMIHEIGHGLGFLDSFDIETGETLNTLPFPYDVFINRGSSSTNKIQGHSSTKVTEDLESDDLFFNGPRAIDASKRSIRPMPMIKLYAPKPYEQGSSISHVDQKTYADFKTGLMTPQDFGSGTDKIDILTLGIMEDIGYVLVPNAVTARQK